MTSPDFEEEHWNALVGHLGNGRCTPILGPDLTDDLIGSKTDLARRWAEEFNMHRPFQSGDDFSRAAQFLAVRQGRDALRQTFVQYMEEALVQRHAGGEGDVDVRNLDAKIAATHHWYEANNRINPFRVLAGLSAPLYVTACPALLLENALEAAGKKPRTECCRWNEHLEGEPSIYDENPDYRPDANHPLVYHLYGETHRPHSLVLSQDDYFEYLIGVTANKELTPATVRRALADSALLITGFHINHWDFRALLRGIMKRGGLHQHRRFAHVTIQVDPQVDGVFEAETARRYLQDYFSPARIHIFWGSSEAFLRELQRRTG